MSALVPLFPTALLVSDRYVLADEERATLLGQAWHPNRSGNETSVDTYVLDAPALSGLAAFLRAQLERYGRDVLGLPKGAAIAMTQSWVNRNPGGSRHHPHDHPNSVVSGVFFIEGDPCPLRLHRDPVPGTTLAFRPSAANAFNARRWEVANEAGVAVLFPSTLRHEVARVADGAVRYSLSFNSFVRGRVGSRRRLTELVL